MPIERIGVDGGKTYSGVQPQLTDPNKLTPQEKRYLNEQIEQGNIMPGEKDRYEQFIEGTTGYRFVINEDRAMKERKATIVDLHRRMVSEHLIEMFLYGSPPVLVRNMADMVNYFRHHPRYEPAPSGHSMAEFFIKPFEPTKNEL